MKNLKLILILVLAIALRFYNINSYPSLNPDEAALGYNAYSLILTGKDEHGQSYPIHFKSFGDYKPGGYVYLAIPSVKLFGLTPFATRLPNLILSIIGIYYFYLLVKLLSKSNDLALLSSLVLTISPWHIHFSRGAWEAGTALSFIVIGTYYFYKDLPAGRQGRKYLFILFYVLSLYTYHSARLVAPLLALYLFFSTIHDLRSIYKKWLFPFLFGILICLPVAISFMNSGGTTRIGGVGLTADMGPINRAEELLNQHANVKFINRAIHNKRVLYLLSWGEKYTSHFNLNYLFIDGDAVPRSKVPDMGLLYLIEIPLLIYGIYKSKNKFFLIWLFIAPIASSITFQAPSALRSLPMVIPLTFFIAYGIHSLPAGRRAIYYLLVTSYIICFAYYMDAYFIHYQKRYPFAWNYGFSTLVPYVNSVKNKYQNIYFTNKYDQPYILYLFFSKYPPLDIQKQIKLTPPDKFGFSTVEKIDNITFFIPDKIPDNSLVISDKMFLP